MAKLLDLAKVKEYLDISNTRFDNQIEKYIPVSYDAMNIYTNNSFDFSSESFEHKYSSSFEAIGSEMIGFKLESNKHLGLNNESIGGKYSFSKDSTIGSSGYPVEIESQLIRFRKLY